MNVLDHSDVHTLCTRRHHIHKFSFINIYNGFKCCLSLLETLSICVAIKNFHDFSFFPINSSHKVYPSARYASATNAVFKDTYIFSKQIVSLNYILIYFSCCLLVAFCILVLLQLCNVFIILLLLLNSTEMNYCGKNLLLMYRFY
jgi:hypothetical protein